MAGNHPKTVNEIRKAFLDYFKSKEHTIVPSSSLIPAGDPTLLFSTAGMVQFKPLFTGAVTLPYTRATSSQKCLRTTDLENVGKTERHCTFFEMLGNFSFGDYFKEGAIEYAWDFSTNVLGFPKEKIWITVYLDDEEAVEIWKKKGVPAERIVRLGKKDNFWGPAGDSGACGPCSELYLDRGVEKAKPDCGINSPCQPGCDCDRFLEFWNIVFNQFNQDTSGVLHPLKQTGIDTGSGLERVALLLQNADSVYDTDELKRIINYIEKKSGVRYQPENAPSFRVMTDHTRAIAFAIADGIFPDKTGRGYVVRRLIRRGVLFAKKIGITEPFLYKIIEEHISIYKDEYPELAAKQNEITKILHSEETQFWNTLELGLGQLSTIVEEYKKSGEKTFSGKDSFRLYGTYGFPPEMTKEILVEYGIEFDDSGFDAELEKDRSLSRESWKGKNTALLTGIDKSILVPTKFSGFSENSSKSKIRFLFQDLKRTQKLKTGDTGVIILDTTPFYGESGGQLGDTGFIKTGNAVFQVTDTQKENDIFLHIGIVLNGNFTEEEDVTAEIDLQRRELLTYHHSGTHLLNGALRNILGTHVSQKASLVSPEYLRFDFSHPKALTDSEISDIENKVNSAIEDAVSVETRTLPISEAKKTGAVSAFDEKYGEIVRVVGMGAYSTEFCGGCHVAKTSDIKYFSILKESGPGAGNRRIEAICGPAVKEYFQILFQNLAKRVQEYNLKAKEIYSADSSGFIKTSIPVPEEIDAMFNKKGSKSVDILRKLKNGIELSLEEKSSKLIRDKKKSEADSVGSLVGSVDNILKDAEIVGGITIVKKVFQDLNVEALRGIGDKLKEKQRKILILFAVESSGSVTFLFMSTVQGVDSGIHCGDLMRKACEMTGGRGGGKPDMAQGGGKEPGKMQDALHAVVEIVKQKLGE